MKEKIVRDKDGKNIYTGDILVFQKNSNETIKYNVVRDIDGKLKAIPVSGNNNLMSWEEKFFQYMYRKDKSDD